MPKKIILSKIILFSATISLFACAPQPGVLVPPTASPSVSPNPSPTPTAAVSASPSPSASPLPSPSPVLSPSPIPSATGSPLPSASPTLKPVDPDIAIIEPTTFNGKIFDDTQSPVDGVTVKARSLNASIPYQASTLTAGGTYAFNNAPSGVQLEIVASKAGFTTRKRVEVLKSNKQGDPNANRYDFGADSPNGSSFSASYNALSDKPEVVMVTPARNGSGVEPKTSFMLKFSEPMDKKTAEDTFTVRSFNSRKLTVDAGNTARTHTVTGNGAVATNFLANNSTQIWDKDAFNISWNSDDTEVTFSFKEEKLLPTDKDSNLVPDYNVAFRSFSGGDRVLKDKSGISRNDKHFKLTDGDFEESYKFAIKTDEVKPTVTGITAETAENGGQNGDAVRVRFSERMIIYSRDISIAGGMENIAGADQKAPAAYPGGAIATSGNTAKNYNTTIVQTGGVTTYAGTWGALGGTAVYDTTDLTHKTVLLLLPTVTAATANNVYYLNAPATITGTFLTDGTANGGGVGEYTIHLVAANGTQTALAAVVKPVDNLANNAALAADLQAKLNAQANALGANAPSANPFTVTATANAITLSFNDTSNKYIGWRQQNLAAGNGTDSLPSFASGGNTLTQNARLNIYQPGDTVRIKVNSTVLDPAGNTLDSARDNASANAS